VRQTRRGLVDLLKRLKVAARISPLEIDVGVASTASSSELSSRRNSTGALAHADATIEAKRR
jgi:hypothetical protein